MSWEQLVFSEHAIDLEPRKRGLVIFNERAMYMVQAEIGADSVTGFPSSHCLANRNNFSGHIRAWAYCILLVWIFALKDQFLQVIQGDRMDLYKYISSLRHWGGRVLHRQTFIRVYQAVFSMSCLQSLQRIDCNLQFYVS